MSISPLGFNDLEAKCLYAVHLLGRKAVQEQIRESVAINPSLTREKCSTIINDLLERKYLIRCDLHTGKVKYLYSVQGDLVITFCDTAKIVLSLLKTEETGGREIGLTGWLKNVGREPTLKNVAKPRDIQERIEKLHAMRYLEKSGDSIQLSYRAHLERLYLILLAENVQLSALATYNLQ